MICTCDQAISDLAKCSLRAARTVDELRDYIEKFEKAFGAEQAMKAKLGMAVCELNDVKDKLDIAVKALEEIKQQTDTAWDGDLMKWWDMLRRQVESSKSSLPRDNFEGFMDDMHTTVKKALAEISELPYG